MVVAERSHEPNAATALVEIAYGWAISAGCWANDGPWQVVVLSLQMDVGLPHPRGGPVSR